MDPDASGQGNIDQGMGLIHVATTRFDQTSSDIESLLLAQAKPLGHKSSATGIDIDLSSPEDEHVLNPRVLHQCGEWAESASRFTTYAPWPHSRHQPGHSGHDLSVTGVATLRGWGRVLCGKPEFPAVLGLFYTDSVGVRFAPPGSATRRYEG